MYIDKCCVSDKSATKHYAVWQWCFAIFICISIIFKKCNIIISSKYVTIVTYRVAAFFNCQPESFLINITTVLISSYSWVDNLFLKAELIIYFKDIVPFIR